MLTTTIPAYPYEQYADDDDIQAFFAAYNAATQNIVTWFATVGLPYYPALSGQMLEWVASGLYGLEKTSLAQVQTPAAGLLNTALLNSSTLNSFTPPQVTYYNITDDIFKRILTWNYYKADGKRFCMKWLKRRVMRFILGANGLDPNPLDPSFVIGTENTQAVSVTVDDDVLTITINGAYVSSLVQLQPNILQIFQAAVAGGVLDLPEQYTYVVDIVSSLTATAAPTMESVVGIATTLTTGTVSVSAIAGTGVYTFAWTWQSGGAGITIVSPASAATSFRATGMTRGAALSGVALCTVTDSSGKHATAIVSVTIKNVSAPTLSIVPASYSNEIATSNLTTGLFAASVVGGAAPYVFAWTWQSGGAGINIASPAGQNTLLEIPSIAFGQALSGTLKCLVTDSFSQQASATSAISITRATQIALSANPKSLTVTSQTTPLTTANVTMTASGGKPPYTYSWSFLWASNTDGASASIGSPTSATTNFIASGMSPGHTDIGSTQCVVTDALGQQQSLSVSAVFTYNPPSPTTTTFASGTNFLVTVPDGYTGCVAEGWGGGCGGQGGFDEIQSGKPVLFHGEGGPAAGYFRSQFAVTGGQQFTVQSVGTPGAGGPPNLGSPTAGGNTVVIFGSSTMSAQGGGPNGPGSATGGNQANDSGGNSVAQTPGAAVAGVYANSAGTNGSGGPGGFGANAGGGVGQSGLVSFHFF